MTNVTTQASTSKPIRIEEKRRTVTSLLAQLILNRMLQVPSYGLGNYIKQRLLYRLRSLLLCKADPLVSYKLHGTELLLPFSHELPMILKTTPHYSRNLPRIAALVASRSRGFTLIDIGANVGDTVVLLRQLAHFPILCIEGSERYFALLSRNLGAFEDVELEHTLVGAKEGMGNVHEERGTGWLVEAEASAGAVPVKKLSDILQGHARFQRPRLIKVDTDGMDCPILASELELLARVKPVLFFEYVPDSLPAPGDGIAFLEQLRGIGYANALVYQNYGDYQLTIDLSDKQRLEDVNAFCEGWGIKRYWDLCVFHADDGAVAEEVRLSELRHFRECTPGGK